MLTAVRPYLRGESFTGGARRWTRISMVLVLIAFINLFLVFNSAFFFDLLPRTSPPLPSIASPAAAWTEGSKTTLDYWTWNTTTEFKSLGDSTGNRTKTGNSTSKSKPVDECKLFPTHLLSKIQVVLRISANDPWPWTQAQLSTVIKCIPNALIASDASHTYGPHHHAINVLEDLSPKTYMTPQDYTIYAHLQQQVQLEQNNPAKDPAPQNKLDPQNLTKYTLFPTIEKAVQKNMLADWYVFLQSDTYVFWDNMFRLLSKYNASLPYYLGTPSPWTNSDGDNNDDNDDDDDNNNMSALKQKHDVQFANDVFVLSGTAAHRLVDKGKSNLWIWREGQRVSQVYKEDVRREGTAGSVLALALREKAGTLMTGLRPLFHTYGFDSVLFGGDECWCEPVASLKMGEDDTGRFRELWEWENGRDRVEHGPILYANLFTLIPLSHFSPNYITTHPETSINTFRHPFNPPSPSSHASPSACSKACRSHSECFQWTWRDEHCRFSKSVSLGKEVEKKNNGNWEGKEDGGQGRVVSGWDVDKIGKMVREKKCEEGAHWVKPSRRTV